MFECIKCVVFGDISVSFYKDTKSGYEGVSVCQGDDSIDMDIEQYRALIEKLSPADKELS